MSNETKTGLELKPYESAVIENLLSIAPSVYLKTAMTKGLNYLETILMNQEDENGEPVSDRALWTAVVASEGTDIEVFLAAILAEVIPRNDKMMYLTAEGFPYYMTLASKALAEDTVDDTLYERIGQQDAKYQSIAVYRSMYRLANIITYAVSEQHLILEEVEAIKQLTMSPSLYAQYELVYTQAVNMYNIMSDFDMLPDDEEDLLGEIEDANDAEIMVKGIEVNEPTEISRAEFNRQKILDLIFTNPTDDIDTLIADEFNCKVGGVIVLPKGNIHYSPQWKQYFDVTGNPINWRLFLDMDTDERYKPTEGETNNVVAVIKSEFSKELSVLTLDRRIATELGISSGDTIVIPSIGECVYNTISGFVSTETGEVVNFTKYIGDMNV